MKKITMFLVALFMVALTGTAAVQANPAAAPAWEALEAGDPPPPPDSDPHKHRKHKEEPPKPPQEPPHADAPKDQPDPGRSEQPRP